MRFILILIFIIRFCIQVMSEGRKLTGYEKQKILALVVESIRECSVWYNTCPEPFCIEHRGLLRSQPTEKMLEAPPDSHSHTQTTEVE